MVAKCNLEFDGFDSFFLKALRKIFEESLFPDVTLVGDDQHPIEAHRIILSAHSSILENALSENKTAKPTLHLKGFNYQNLSFLMQYMYLGEVSLPIAKASELLKMAKYLQISQLGEECNIGNEVLNGMYSLVFIDDFVSNDGLTFKADDSSQMNYGKESFNPLSTADVNEDYKDEIEDESQSFSEGDRSQEGMSLDKMSQKYERFDVYPGRGEDVEGPDYGANMVGRRLPNFSLSRSVAYTHYYFVKSKPINGKIWARCNLCWYNIGTEGRIKKFMKIHLEPSSTSALINHIRNTHPEVIEQFLQQKAEARKEFKILEQEKKKQKRKLKEEKIEKKELIKEMKMIDDKYKKKRNVNTFRYNQIDKLSASEPDYDFEHLDEDILSTTVGEPRDNHDPYETVIYSHNFFRRIYPTKIQDRTSFKSIYSECVPCVQRNSRTILRKTRGSTTCMFVHIEANHPELASLLGNLRKEKKDSLDKLRGAFKTHKRQIK